MPLSISSDGFTPARMISKYILYTGPSMNPLLQAGDGLEVVPYGEQPVRRGDVIVYPHPFESRNIVHRVIAAGPEGFRTRGDNNSEIDPYWIPCESILGRVTTFRRGKKTRIVQGGLPGLALHHLFLFRRRVRACAFRYPHALYHSFARTGVFHGWHRPFVTPRLVQFQHDQGIEMQLLVKGRIIARRLPGKQTWETRFPFDLFLDETDLPCDFNRSPR